MAEKTIELDILLNLNANEVNTVKELKQNLKDLRSAALSVEEGSEAFTKITQKAGELNDKISRVNESIKANTGNAIENASKGFLGLARIGTSAFSAIQGASALFGSESEDLQKVLVKLNGVMAFTQGLEGLSNLDDKIKDIGAQFQLTANQTKLLGQAIGALGIAGAAFGFALLTEQLFDYIYANEEAAQQTKLFSDILNDTAEAAGKELGQINQLNKIVLDSNAKTKDRVKALDELKKINQDVYGGIKDIAQAEKEINDKTPLAVASAIKRAKANVLQAESTKLITDIVKIQLEFDRIQDDRLKNGGKVDAGIALRLNLIGKAFDITKKKLDSITALQNDLGTLPSTGQTTAPTKIQKVVGEDIDALDKLAEAQKKADEERKKRDQDEFNESVAINRLRKDEILKIQDELTQGLINAENLRKESVRNNESEINQVQQAALDDFKKQEEAKYFIAQKGVEAIGLLGEILGKEGKKQAAFQKAVALAQIAIDTAKAISSLVAMSNANPANAVTVGAAGIAQFAAGIIQIVANIAQAKRILFSKDVSAVAGGGGGGGAAAASGTAGSIPSTPVPSTPNQFALFGTGGSSNQGGAVDDTGVGAQRIYVLESDITNTQNRVVSLVAEIG